MARPKKDYRRERQNKSFHIYITDSDTVASLREKLKDAPDDAYVAKDHEFSYYDNELESCDVFVSWERPETDDEYNQRMLELDEQIKKEEERKAKNAAKQKEREQKKIEKQKEKDLAELKRLKELYGDA